MQCPFVRLFLIVASGYWYVEKGGKVQESMCRIESRICCLVCLIGRICRRGSFPAINRGTTVRGLELIHGFLLVLLSQVRGSPSHADAPVTFEDSLATCGHLLPEPDDSLPAPGSGLANGTGGSSKRHRAFPTGYDAPLHCGSGPAPFGDGPESVGSGPVTVESRAARLLPHHTAVVWIVSSVLS